MHKHRVVKYRLNFVDPVTLVHTQTVERMWGSAKWRNKKHRGRKLFRKLLYHHLESYFLDRKLLYQLFLR